MKEAGAVVSLPCTHDLPLSTRAPYLLEVSNSKHRTALCRFRTSRRDLGTERERCLPPAFPRPSPKAPRHERTRLVCAPSAIEAATHLVFHCPLFDDLRFQ